MYKKTVAIGLSALILGALPLNASVAKEQQVTESLIPPSESIFKDNPLPGSNTKGTEKIEGEVTKTTVQTKPVEDDMASYITVTKEPVPLRSRLKKQYAGYKLTITNNWKNPVEIVSAQVISGTNGQQGYLMVEKGSGAAIGGLLGGGLLVGIFTLGIGFLVGLVASPIVWGVNKAKNNKARKEGMQFSNQVPFGAMNAGETVTFATLVPAGSDAQLKATLRDSVTRELFTVSK